jgi:CRP-like cAMP-binding protein
MTASVRPPNQLLQLLDADVFGLLQPHLSTIALARTTILGEQGTAQRHAYFPHDGAVSMTVNLAEGQTIAVALIGRDSVIGGGAALADGRAPTDTAVLFPCTASVLELTVLRNVANANARFRRLIVRHEQALLAQAQQSLLCNTLHPVEARLSRWLLRARDLCDREALPLTQEVLAQMIGVRRNAVSIVAHTLQQAGTIRYSRGQIEIIDAEALAATSCACHSTVKMHYERLLRAEP